MGQQMTTNKHKIPKGEEVSRNRFDFQNIIGKGGFGKVWKVVDKKSKNQYALKEMSKVRIIDKKSEKSIIYERELLARLRHPFIVNMHYAFQDYENLYLVMDLLGGGDLRYHICRHRKFSEEQTRFFIACIVQSLEYIHSKKVIHRDIKPENLVLEDNGYVRVTDFGIAKVFSNKNSHETSGTPGYMAPEVMKGQNHTMAVDYFALGIMGYELMLGKRPYLGRSRKEIKEHMMAKQACIKNEEAPDGWSEESVEFINLLLLRKPEKRLGYKGAQDLKNHPWMKYYPWKNLSEKTIDAPFLPEKKENYDKKYCNSVDKIGLDTKNRYDQYKQSESFCKLFYNFTYYPIGNTVTNSNSNTNFSKKSSKNALYNNRSNSHHNIINQISNNNKIAVSPRPMCRNLRVSKNNILINSNNNSANNKISYKINYNSNPKNNINNNINKITNKTNDNSNHYLKKRCQSASININNKQNNNNNSNNNNNNNSNTNFEKEEKKVNKVLNNNKENNNLLSTSFQNSNSKSNIKFGKNLIPKKEIKLDHSQINEHIIQVNSSENQKIQTKSKTTKNKKELGNEFIEELEEQENVLKNNNNNINKEKKEVIVNKLKYNMNLNKANNIQIKRMFPEKILTPSNYYNKNYKGLTNTNIHKSHNKSNITHIFTPNHRAISLNERKNSSNNKNKNNYSSTKIYNKSTEKKINVMKKSSSNVNYLIEKFQKNTNINKNFNIPISSISISNSNNNSNIPSVRGKISSVIIENAKKINNNNNIENKPINQQSNNSNFSSNNCYDTNQSTNKKNNNKTCINNSNQNKPQKNDVNLSNNKNNNVSYSNTKNKSLFQNINKNYNIQNNINNNSNISDINKKLINSKSMTLLFKNTNSRDSTGHSSNGNNNNDKQNASNLNKK